ncbi:MAG: GNAT family N-acetyltransferase [Lachnospiraceae bacterium]|nr:GNAT family N-acetyltransferase [Lachnospiraceae bacterium]
MQYRNLDPDYDRELAELIRRNLEARNLDIPGTAYYDENLYHLSDFYTPEPDKRVYRILVDEDGTLAGGVGIAECFVPDGSADTMDCAELQKLYLDDRYKGRGLGYDLMAEAERAARERGYKRIYLETHDNLDIAIHLYQQCGYNEIERPASVVHSTMNRFFLKELQ